MPELVHKVYIQCFVNIAGHSEVYIVRKYKPGSLNLWCFSNIVWSASKTTI